MKFIFQKMNVLLLIALICSFVADKGNDNVYSALAQSNEYNTEYESDLDLIIDFTQEAKPLIAIFYSVASQLTGLPASINTLNLRARSPPF